MFGVGILGALLWRALHPVPHAYMTLPRNLFTLAAVAILVAGVLQLRGLGNASKLLGMIYVATTVCPTVPESLRLDASARAILDLARGEDPALPPRGTEVGFGVGGTDMRAYAWADYRAVLGQLRTAVPPETRVLNLLRRFPFPPVNGPAGRRDVTTREGGICWQLMVGEDLDAEVAEEIGAAADAVVVWVPDERPDDRMPFPLTLDAVRKGYSPWLRCGAIEVWRRREGD